MIIPTREESKFWIVKEDGSAMPLTLFEAEQDLADTWVAGKSTYVRPIKAKAAYAKLR